MWACWRADILRIGADVGPCKKKKKKAKEREKKKVHTAGGGRERADGPCGSVFMRVCRWACRCVGTWMRMAVNTKEKRRKQTWRVEHVDGSVGVWACGRADGRAAMWTCRCGWL